MYTRAFHLPHVRLLSVTYRGCTSSPMTTTPTLWRSSQSCSMPPAHAVVRQMPAAALTAYARSEDRVKALRASFQIHLAKPIDPGELLATVAALVKPFAPARAEGLPERS